MGSSSDKNKKDEMSLGHKPIPMKIANQIMNSICKITIKKEGGIIYGTGFFMNISDSQQYLITNFHIINPSVINDDIEIEIWNHKKMHLNIINRDIKYIKKPKDITIIEIKKTDPIFNDVYILDYDTTYINKGYKIYKNTDIFSIEHPYGDDASCASGTVVEIDDYEFDHNVATDNGSSGCPILLLNTNINLVKVIGIHKNADTEKKINGGTFIGEIFKEIKIKKEVNKETNERLIEIKFCSTDKVINYPIICKDTDNFLKLKEKLYLEYPLLKNNFNCFLINGNIINESENLIKNGIKNGDSIIILSDEPKSQPKINAEIMAVNFIAFNQSFQFPVPCKSSDNFSVLEKILFREYPELRNKKVYYLTNGTRINTRKTLEQNRIKNGSNILVCTIED